MLLRIRKKTNLVGRSAKPRGKIQGIAVHPSRVVRASRMWLANRGPHSNPGRMARIRARSGNSTGFLAAHKARCASLNSRAKALLLQDAAIGPRFAVRKTAASKKSIVSKLSVLVTAGLRDRLAQIHRKILGPAMRNRRPSIVHARAVFFCPVFLDYL